MILRDILYQVLIPPIVILSIILNYVNALTISNNTAGPTVKLRPSSMFTLQLPSCKQENVAITEKASNAIGRYSLSIYGLLFDTHLKFRILASTVRFFKFGFNDGSKCARHYVTDSLTHFIEKKNAKGTKAPSVILNNWKESLYREEKQSFRQIVNTPIPLLANLTTTSTDYKSLGLANMLILNRIAEYQALSYCHEVRRLFPSHPRNAVLKTLRIGNFQLLDYGLNDHCELAWYLAVNHQQQQITLVHRGMSPRNTWQDSVNALNFSAIPIPEQDFTCAYSIPPTSPPTTTPRKLIHGGFYKHFKEYQEPILHAVRRMTLNQQFANYDFVVSGHSLGAVLAFLNVAHWKNYPDEIIRKPSALVLFASPRVGNIYAVNTLAKCIGSSKMLRAVDSNDGIVHMGFEAFDLPRPKDGITDKIYQKEKTGAHPDKVKELFYDRDPKSATANQFILCQRPNVDTTCSARYKDKCEEWSWENHSSFGDILMKSSYCKMDPYFP